MIHMATKDQIIDTLIGIIVGGRGGHNPGGNPYLDIPTFREALEEDRRPKRKARQAKRAVSASQKRYGRAFKRLSPRYKKKNGGWKKDGFKRCVRAAHADCRRNNR